MLKVFISQPMNGKTDEEILAERKNARNACKKLYLSDDVEFINSFFQKAPVGVKPLWYLGESIKLLSEADIVCFVKGWDTARGCVIEHKCAEEYGLKIIEL